MSIEKPKKNECCSQNHILIVDDNEFNLMTISLLLKEYFNCTYIEAMNG